MGGVQLLAQQNVKRGAICDKLGFVELNLEHILQMSEYRRISLEEREKIYSA